MPSYLLIFVLLISAGCGVKSRPVPPPGTELPSYVGSFLKKKSQEPLAPEEDQEKKQEDNKEQNGP